MTARGAERALARLLLVLGLLTLTAVFAMFMPTGWMAAANDWLGLDPFHRSPLTEYLTRSLSAVYALFGAMAVYVSRDLVRHLGLVLLMSRLTIVFGLYLTGLGFWADLPPGWVWAEGPPSVALGIVMLWLARRVAAGAAAGEPAS